MTPHHRPTTHIELAKDLEDLTAKVDALNSKIEGLVKAWENATFLVAVIKWLAGAVTAVSAFYFVVTHFGQGK